MGYTLVPTEVLSRCLAALIKAKWTIELMDTDFTKGVMALSGFDQLFFPSGEGWSDTALRGAAVAVATRCYHRGLKVDL